MIWQSWRRNGVVWRHTSGIHFPFFLLQNTILSGSSLYLCPTFSLRVKATEKKAEKIQCVLWKKWQYILINWWVFFFPASLSWSCFLCFRDDTREEWTERLRRKQVMGKRKQWNTNIRRTNCAAKDTRFLVDGHGCVTSSLLPVSIERETRLKKCVRKRREEKIALQVFYSFASTD